MNGTQRVTALAVLVLVLLLSPPLLAGEADSSGEAENAPGLAERTLRLRHAQQGLQEEPPETGHAHALLEPLLASDPDGLATWLDGLAFLQEARWELAYQRLLQAHRIAWTDSRAGEGQDRIPRLPLSLGIATIALERDDEARSWLIIAEGIESTREEARVWLKALNQRTGKAVDQHTGTAPAGHDSILTDASAAFSSGMVSSVGGLSSEQTTPYDELKGLERPLGFVQAEGALSFVPWKWLSLSTSLRARELRDELDGHLIGVQTNSQDTDSEDLDPGAENPFPARGFSTLEGNGRLGMVLPDGAALQLEWQEQRLLWLPLAPLRQVAQLGIGGRRGSAWMTLQVHHLHLASLYDLWKELDDQWKDLEIKGAPDGGGCEPPSEAVMELLCTQRSSGSGFTLQSVWTGAEGTTVGWNLRLFSSEWVWGEDEGTSGLGNSVAARLALERAVPSFFALRVTPSASLELLYYPQATWAETYAAVQALLKGEDPDMDLPTSTWMNLSGGLTVLVPLGGSGLNLMLVGNGMLRVGYIPKSGGTLTDDFSLIPLWEARVGLQLQR